MFGNVFGTYIRMMNKNATVLRSWQVSRKRSSSSSSSTTPRTKNRPDPEPTRRGNKNKQFQPTKQPTVTYQPTVSSQFQPKWFEKKNSFNQLQPSFFGQETYHKPTVTCKDWWWPNTHSLGSGKISRETYPRCWIEMAYLPTFWEVLGGQWW